MTDIMSVNCKTPEELSKAIKEKEEFIVIEGDLKNKVFRIKAVGKAVWGVCAVALGVAIAICIAAPAAIAGITAGATPVGGAVTAVSSVAATATATTVAATTLGSATATATAITIGVTAGGIGVLNTLRDRYKIVEKDDEHIKLQRK